MDAITLTIWYLGFASLGVNLEDHVGTRSLKDVIVHSIKKSRHVFHNLGRWWWWALLCRHIVVWLVEKPASWAKTWCSSFKKYTAIVGRSREYFYYLPLYWAAGNKLNSAGEWLVCMWGGNASGPICSDLTITIVKIPERSVGWQKIRWMATDSLTVDRAMSEFSVFYVPNLDSVIIECAFPALPLKISSPGRSMWARPVIPAQESVFFNLFQRNDRGCHGDFYLTPRHLPIVAY
jgi:hypothetical protein